MSWESAERVSSHTGTPGELAEVLVGEAWLADLELGAPAVQAASSQAAAAMAAATSPVIRNCPPMAL